MTARKAVDIALWTVTALSVVALVLAALGGYCDPASWGFVPGVMALLLPFIVVIASAWLVAVAVMRRWRHTVAVALGLLVCMPVACTQCPVRLSHPVNNGSDRFTVMTYNVAAFPHLYRQDSSTVMRNILDINADVVLMQDMSHWDREFHYDTIRGLKPYYDELNRKYPYRSYTYQDEVGILSRYPFTMDTIVEAKRGFETLNYLRDLEHRPAMAYDIVVNGRRVRLISAHLQSYGLSSKDKSITGTNVDNAYDVMPGSELEGMSLPAKLNRAFALRAADARALRAAIDRSPGTVILGADFNDVAGSYAYRTVMGEDMTDSWAQAGRGYAWTYAMHRFYFKIDHIFYRGDVRAVDSRVYSDLPLTYTGSDHYPQVTTFEFIK